MPTLIIYRAGEFVAHVEGSKYLAEHIPGATYVELEGVDYHPYVGDQDAILDPIEEFLTGTRRLAPASATALVTLLAVGSAGRAWPDQAVAALVEGAAQFNGTVGRGPGGVTVLTFDGPARAIACALALRASLGALHVDVGIGAHIGEVERRGAEVSGAAVGIAAEVQSHAAPGKLLVSRTLTDLLAGSDFTLTDAGERALAGVATPWQLFEVSAPGDARPAGPSSPRIEPTVNAGVFRREGDVWLLSYLGTSVRIRDTKGLADIALLLSRAGREVHVAELVGAGLELGPRPTTDALLDGTAIAAYRARLDELAEEEDEAHTRGDVEGEARAMVEREAILERVASDVGLGGRARSADDWAERARKAVRTRVANTLKRIEGEHPPLGRHLRSSVRTGAFCAYEPPEPVIWQL